jgi:hypothetical protein
MARKELIIMRRPGVHEMSRRPRPSVIFFLTVAAIIIDVADFLAGSK